MTHNIIFRIIQSSTVKKKKKEEEEAEVEEVEEKEGGGEEEEETMQAATDLSEELFQEQAGPFRVEIPVLGRVTDVGTVQH